MEDLIGKLAFEKPRNHTAMAFRSSLGQSGGSRGLTPVILNNLMSRDRAKSQAFLSSNRPNACGTFLFSTTL